MNSLDNNYLNRHPGAKYFSNLYHRKSRNGNGLGGSNISFLQCLPTLKTNQIGSRASSEVDNFHNSAIFTLNRQLSQESQYSEKSNDNDQCTCKRCVTRAICDSEKALNSVSRIDRVSRVVFPSTYIIINIIYWYLYLDRSERIAYASEDGLY